MDTGWSYGCAFGDYDNDGFQDLAVATTRFGGVDDADFFYHNNGNDNHWILLSLEGKTSNRSAIGARVRLKSIVQDTATWQMREVSAQSAYCSQNDLRVHFGIGDATVIDSIVIEWPSGIVQYLTKVMPDQIFDIEEELVNAVRDKPSPFGLMVFPNPTNSSINIDANFKSIPDKLFLEVFGDTGQIVYRTAFSHVASPWHHHLDLTQLHLTAGHYVVRISDGRAGEERKIVFIK
jgi:hypothetical protein